MDTLSIFVSFEFDKDGELKDSFFTRAQDTIPYEGLWYVDDRVRWKWDRINKSTRKYKKFEAGIGEYRDPEADPSPDFHVRQELLVRPSQWCGTPAK